MPTLTVTKTYNDTEVLTEQMLDTAFDSIEEFLNTTLLGEDNLQAGSVGSSQLQASSVTGAKLAAGAVTTDKVEDLAITEAKLAAAIVAKLNPPGGIQAYGGTSAPTGWLMCDGSAVSRSTYNALFTAIGIAFGSGDGSTTFNVPDFRGRFLRMVDGSAGRDPDKLTRTAMNSGGNTGNAVGSVQDDAFEAHEHSGGRFSNAALPTGGSTDVYASGSGTSGNLNTSSVGGNETRPVNANVNFIIKT